MCFLDNLVPLVNDNQIWRCLPIGMMSTFALTIWLYSITFIFLYVSLQMDEKKWWKPLKKNSNQKC